VTIFAATNGFADGFEIRSLAKFETELFSFMKDRHGALLTEIRRRGRSPTRSRRSFRRRWKSSKGRSRKNSPWRTSARSGNGSAA